MTIEMPHARGVFLPRPPSDLDPKMQEYLRQLITALERQLPGHFDNAYLIAQALNSGTSGAFTINSGGNIVVTSGVVISVTS